MEPKFKIENPPIKKDFAEDAKVFIRTNTPIFNTLADDTSLKYKVGSGFCIDFTKGEITLDKKDWEWKEKFGLDNNFMLWSTGHEIAHFWDMKEDAKGMMENFDYMLAKAEQMESQVRARLVAANKPIPKWADKQIPKDRKKPEEKISGLASFIYQRLHMLYNCLDDIYVNKRVGMKLGQFSLDKKKHSPMVKRLYQDFLFSSEGEPGKPARENSFYDIENEPKSKQLAYSLLRRRMVPDQGIIMDKEVKEALAANTKLGMSLETLVEQVTDPSFPGAKLPHIASWRYKNFKLHIEPIFWKFFLDDMEKFGLPADPPKSEENGSGNENDEDRDGQPGNPNSPEGAENSKDNEDDDSKDFKTGKQSKKGPWDDNEEMKISPISREDIENFIKTQAEKAKEEKLKKEKAKKLNPQALAKEAQKKADNNFAKKHEIPSEVMEEYRMISDSVDAFKDELAKVFERLSLQLQSSLEMAWEGYWRSGRLEVKELVRKYGYYFQDGAIEFLPFDALDIYEQRSFIEKIKLKPEELRVRFVVDNSGSMSGERMLAAKQALVALLESLATFQDKMARDFKRLNISQDPIHIGTQIITFSYDAEEVKKLNRPKSGINQEQEKVERILSLGKLDAHGGSTENAHGWELVWQSILPEDEQRIKDGQLKDLAFEITDGGSQTPQEAVNIINALEKRGVICRGLQMIPRLVNDDGTVESDSSYEQRCHSDMEVFESIWGNNGERVEFLSQFVKTVQQLFLTEINKIDFHFELEK